MGSYAYPYVSDLPYAPFMKHAILKITEHSLYHMREHWKIETPICKSELEGKPLSFKKLISMFLVFFLGVVLALITLFCEVKTANPRNQNQKQSKGLDKTMIIHHDEELKDIKQLMEDIEELHKSCRSSNVTVRIVIQSRHKHPI